MLEGFEPVSRVGALLQCSRLRGGGAWERQGCGVRQCRGREPGEVPGILTSNDSGN